MQANFTTRQVKGVSILDVTGRITVGAGSNALREALRRLMDSGKKKILVNLSECSYMDSSGVGELVSAFKEVTEAGGRLKLLGLSGHITYQMLIAKSCTFFEMYVDEGAAIRSFRSNRATS